MPQAPVGASAWIREAIAEKLGGVPEDEEPGRVVADWAGARGWRTTRAYWRRCRRCAGRPSGRRCGGARGGAEASLGATSFFVRGEGAGTNPNRAN